MAGIASRRRFAREHGQRLTPPARILPSRGARMRIVEVQPPPPMETLPTPLRRQPPPTPTGGYAWGHTNCDELVPGYVRATEGRFLCAASPASGPRAELLTHAHPAWIFLWRRVSSEARSRDVTRGKTAHRRCCYREVEERDDRGLPSGHRRALGARRLCRQLPRLHTKCGSVRWSGCDHRADGHGGAHGQLQRAASSEHSGITRRFPRNQRGAVFRGSGTGAVLLLPRSRAAFG
ncbi:hypothetical protein ABB37_03278 [Leptomonas pyrrhocoris]|uniref:Uncharacterized protein n=1 Tax=Leptomonas pyrrhocoris TaxID=157538 RepID=A0A0N0DWX5_LEPPY|nr:hypothetical protein ABB37_03278 [Leptomonas pyrrhocoris]KPA82142.1 hypothetical protein ABB37_03278 [Leptomonas pyrrhocoris]|eukprot:XP_015660581.1 hypothetical protein ABB37_03278 [Leptomonas pyrrhocoris]